jgi:hypothetical protein
MMVVRPPANQSHHAKVVRDRPAILTCPAHQGRHDLETESSVVRVLTVLQYG